MLRETEREREREGGGGVVRRARVVATPEPRVGARRAHSIVGDANLYVLYGVFFSFKVKRNASHPFKFFPCV